MNNGMLKTILGFGATAIASEHFFSASLSSPVSVKALKQNPQDVRDAYIIAVVLSLFVGYIFTIMLIKSGIDKKSAYIPMITAGAICGIYVFLYERALAGKRLLPI